MSRGVTVIGAVGLTLLAVVLVVQLVTLVPALRTTTPAAEQSGIMVMGEGKVSAEPDIAMATIGIETRSETAQRAAEDNKKQMADVMEAVQGLGIASEDIQTVDYSIRPEMDWDDEKEPRVIGYVVSNAVLVKVREIDRVGDVMDAATQAGANNIYGIQFTFDDPSQLREEARTKAMADARSKAEALANLAGVGLGKVRLVNESFVESPQFYAGERAAVGMGGGEVPISPGQLEVTVQVQLTYEIR